MLSATVLGEYNRAAQFSIASKTVPVNNKLFFKNTLKPLKFSLKVSLIKKLTK